MIVIDDGSRDATWQVLLDLSKKYTCLQAKRFQFNCGKAAGLSLGFSLAKGEYVATLDGDLQDDPREIPKMIEILESGYDLVSGWKIKRLDPWHKTWPSKLFNLTVSLVCGKRLHDFISPAASLMAARMLAYAPQRQMLPLIRSRISSAVVSGAETKSTVT